MKMMGTYDEGADLASRSQADRHSLRLDLLRVSEGSDWNVSEADPRFVTERQSTQR